jgi:hypothetical protein
MATLTERLAERRAQRTARTGPETVAQRRERLLTAASSVTEAIDNALNITVRGRP